MDVTVDCDNGTQYAINDIVSVHSSSDNGLYFISDIQTNDLLLVKMTSGSDPGASCVLRKADQFVVSVSGLYEVFASMSVSGAAVSCEYEFLCVVYDDSAGDVILDESFHVDRKFSNLDVGVWG